MRTELKKTLKIAYPLSVANLIQILMGIIDAAMVGQIHSDLLAATSLVNSVVNIPFIFAMGLTMAVAPLIAAAVGSNDHKAPAQILVNALWIAGGVGLLLGLGIHVGAPVLYAFGQDPTIVTLSIPYLKIIGWSLLPMILFLTIKQFADGIEETKLPMLISLYTIPVNVFLNYVLIYGVWGFPRLELEGAGVATLITRAVLLAAMVFILFKHSKMAVFIDLKETPWRPVRKYTRQILKIGIPSSMQYGMEAWAFSVSGIMVGWLGAQALAAHQIALSLASFTFVIALGFSGAGAIRIGNNFGRKDWSIVSTIGKGVLWLGVGYGLACAFLFILLRDQLPILFNREPEVVLLASGLLILAAIFQVSDAVQAIGVGLLRGLQDVRVPTFLVGIAYWVIGIPGGYLLAFVLDWGVKGIWIGFLLGLTASAILMSIRFIRMTKSLANTQVPFKNH